ncbi:MAG: hypothetical protein ACI4FY_09180 [Acetatifactor sp.]
MRKINRINLFLLVMIILLSAFLLPVVSSKWMQRTLEGKSSTIDLSVTLYQREFTDLWEKIETLEKSFASKQVQQKKVVITDELRKKFTASAKKQMETMSTLQWFHSFPELTEESLQEVYENTIISNDDCSGMVWYQLQFQDVSMLMDPDTGVAVSLHMLTESAAEDFFSMDKYLEVDAGNVVEIAGNVAVDVGKDKNKVALKQDSLRWELFQYNQAMLPELLPSNYGTPTGDYIYSGAVTESAVSNIVNIDGVIFLLEYVPYEERVMVRLGFFETGQLMPLD